jgi:ABC-type nickel/cobalt efflux system permease component RcnA
MKRQCSVCFLLYKRASRHRTEMAGCGCRGCRGRGWGGGSTSLWLCNSQFYTFVSTLRMLLCSLSMLILLSTPNSTDASLNHSTTAQHTTTHHHHPTPPAGQASLHGPIPQLPHSTPHRHAPRHTHIYHTHCTTHTHTHTPQDLKQDKGPRLFPLTALLTGDRCPAPPRLASPSSEKCF